MSNFEDLALKYVLADDDSVQRDAAQSAAQNIEKAHANSTAVGSWASSIQQWIAGSSQDDSQQDHGGDIIARAKALGFLADTLEALDPGCLKADQVSRFVAFFGAMFSYDHKAGINAATKALQQLRRTKNFKPSLGINIIDNVTKLGDDFRLQTPDTRLRIFELLLDLLQDPGVNSELQHKDGSSSGFAVGLLQLCQHERDPQNLMLWFKVLKILITDYSPSPEVTEELFKAFSAYFPISLRSSATASGITADDLKAAVRDCFASHQCLAPHTFPFLLQKLDQGDAVTVSIKVDILKTIKACVDQYQRPETSVAPHMRKIWDSLKYEVRNGEVKETIDATLDVIRAIPDKFTSVASKKLDLENLNAYSTLVFQDCLDDLSNPTYTKQSGLLLATAVTTNFCGYVLHSQKVISAIEKNLRQPKSPTHRKDLLSLLNLVLTTRREVYESTARQAFKDLFEVQEEPPRTMVYDVYLPIWTEISNSTDKESIAVLKETIQGMALLVRQEVELADGRRQLLLSRATCAEISSLLSQRLLRTLSLSSRDNTNPVLEDEVILALRSIVMSYTDGFGELVDGVTAEILRRDWTHPSPYALEALKNILTKLAFIGCSELPVDVSTDVPSQIPYSALQHFVKLVGALLLLCPLQSNSPANPEANSYIISSIHGAMLNFRDACLSRYGHDAQKTDLGGDTNWTAQFESLPEDWLQKSPEAAQLSISEGDALVFSQFLRLSLFTVRYLYRSASKSSQPAWDDRVLSSLASLAAFVVRSLDEKLQESCGLAAEAFNFFLTAGSQESPAQAEILTMGILEGLHPRAMTSLYAPGGIAEKFMCDLDRLGSVTWLVSQVRAGIGAILSNKYLGGPGTSDPESKTLKNVLEFWGKQITAGTSPDCNPELPFKAYSTMALYIAAGAVARMDRSAVKLIPAIHAAIASPHENGELMSRSLEILVAEIPFLSVENHAVVKPIFKQWIYSQALQPLYAKALPPAKGLEASRYANAILAAVKHCPFTVYEADLTELIRLLVTTVSKRTAAPATEALSLAQATAALRILLDILAADSAALLPHLHTLINGAVELHAAAASAQRRDPHAATCRRLALQFLGALPGKFEERHLLAYTPQTQRMLAAASGDPAREVRRVALLARESWSKVA